MSTITVSPATAFSAAETRMLLASDGSTTLLLQALLGRRLHLEVPYQSRFLALEFPHEIRAAIEADPHHELLVRHSELRTESGAVVSRNLVVANAEQRGAMYGLLGDRRTPLGHGLIALGLSQSRRLIASGLDHWEADGSAARCAFKSYVLSESGVPSIYIHERFNPEFVPADRAPAATALDAPRASAAVPEDGTRIDDYAILRRAGEQWDDRP
ncbi:hypothetical protein [Kitasatospora sp. MAP5-34]|uniref:hypothetical protein n=1 Tax=Kitasatospora sp. MAP5-34 TaxID=3035102 RepID=UPI002475ACF4|nr:hypothetical protein [Kitasatospora sp. MAP5-34]MDH6579254.1 hypothetical protein [Kitasatospora sp. MAP5-34]